MNDKAQSIPVSREESLMDKIDQLEAEKAKLLAELETYKRWWKEGNAELEKYKAIAKALSILI